MGLLLAALSLVVTIPDVCANIAGVKYLDWCKEYLDLPNSGEKIAAARKERKTEEEIAKAFDDITARGIFTTSINCGAQSSMPVHPWSWARARITAPTRSSGYASRATSVELSRATGIQDPGWGVKGTAHSNA